MCAYVACNIYILQLSHNCNIGIYFFTMLIFAEYRLSLSHFDFHGKPVNYKNTKIKIKSFSFATKIGK